MSFISQPPSFSNCGTPSITRYKPYPTPSAQLLHSSTFLPIEQVQVYRNTALDIQSGLLLIDNQIARAQASIEQFVSARQRLHRSLIHYRTLASPIRRLPTEILSEIFKALPRDPEVEPFGISNSPVLLTRVCSRWREVAISIQSLWDIIDFTVDDKLNIKPFSMVMWFTWLSRSGVRPLSIRVQFEPSRVSDFPYSEIITMLTSCSNRWRHVYIVAPFSFRQFPSFQGSLPILQSLTVISNNPVAPSHLPPISGVAPNLQAVTLDSQSLILMRYWVPWSQLKLFFGGHIPIDKCLFILEHCEKLTSCELLCQGRARTIHTPQCPQLRPNLQRLGIHIDDKNSCSYIFDYLTCPALKSLHMQPLTNRRLVWPQDHLSTFLARSGCSLQGLSLHDISLEDLHLVTCLAELPSLNELDIRECDDPLPPVMWHLFDRMTYGNQLGLGDESTLLVPKLKVLKLEINFVPQGEILEEMIQSRWDLLEGKRVARLESVRLKFRHGVNWIVPFTRMGCLRDEGLDVTISFEGKRWL